MKSLCHLSSSSVLQTFPFFGVVPAILNESGEELEGPSEGYLVSTVIVNMSGNDVNPYFCVSPFDSSSASIAFCFLRLQQVFKQPWPGVMRTVYGNHPRFETTYFKKFPGYYVTGDGERPDLFLFFYCIFFLFCFVVFFSSLITCSVVFLIFNGSLSVFYLFRLFLVLLQQV